MNIPHQIPWIFLNICTLLIGSFLFFQMNCIYLKTNVTNVQNVEEICPGDYDVNY